MRKLKFLLLFATVLISASLFLTSCNDEETGDINMIGNFTHYIGEQYGGGVIFHLWKDNTGVEHGLIVTLTDQSTSQDWSNVTTTSIGIPAQSLWDGVSNSNAIVGQVGHTSSAAKLCLDLVSGGKSDWYLPAIDELERLYQNRMEVNATLRTMDGATELKRYTSDKRTYYWSSTEKEALNAIIYCFDKGYLANEFKTETNNVRAVRAF